MTRAWYAIGTTLANMTNVETYFSEKPPHIIPDGAICLRGGVQTQTASGKWRRDGFPDATRLMWDAPLTYTELNAFRYAIWTSLTTENASVYISAIDEAGFYSPFYVEAAQPYNGTHYTVSDGGYIRGLTVPLGAVALQSTSVAADHTLTTSQRLLYVNTSGATRTVTLFDVATATLNTVYSVVKTSASNSLVLDGSGAQTIGGAATKTVTALNHRVDFYTDNGTSWTVLNDRV